MGEMLAAFQSFAARGQLAFPFMPPLKPANAMAAHDGADLIAARVSPAARPTEAWALVSSPRIGVETLSPPMVQPSERLRWRALLEAHLDARKEHVASSNTDAGRAAHLIRIIGDVVVVETNEATFRHYRTVRAGEMTKRGGQPAPKTVNNEIELARRAARWGARRKDKLIAMDPFLDMLRDEVFVPVENVRRNVVEDDPNAALTIAQYLDGADLFERALVLIAHSSGMRRNEIAQMEMSWIDRTPDAEGRPLRIVDIPVGIAKGKKGKRRGRQTWISVEALAALDAYRASWPAILRRRCPWAFANTIQLKDGSPGKHFGHHLHKDYLSQRFRELDDRVGVTGPSGPTWLHDLRRSFITLARRRGESTSNIRQASGHLTEAAFERYDIHSRGDAIVVRDRIEAARARELAALEQQRKAPHRAPASSVADIATREIGQHGVSKHLTL